ncbi:unnamed protein product, partial [Symbiodinium sp. CCMP2456]
WNPNTDHPNNMEGKYVAFLSETDQHLHKLSRVVDASPIEVASGAFGQRPEDIRLRVPIQRPHRLFWKGRRLHSVIAVIPNSTYPGDSYRTVIVDLRGIGGWIQWVAIRGEHFDIGAYLEDIQVEYVQDYSLVVQGGRRDRGPTILKVADGELLEVSLRRTAELTPSEGEQEEDDGSDDDSSSGSRGALPGSSEFSRGSPPRGPGPFGPPPPVPVNRPRSRSPRRSPERTPEMGDRQLLLADRLPGVSYDLQEELLELPHDVRRIGQTFHIWPPDWLSVDVSLLQLRQETKEAMKSLVHWTQVLLAGGREGALEAELYVDGSYFSKKTKSGYAVAIFLRCSGLLALFGMVGGPILGGGETLWGEDTRAPALMAEQVAVAVALLWIGQSAQHIQLSHARVLFDCCAAGLGASGEWSGQDEFTVRLRNLERYVRGTIHQFTHIRAHQGQEWNELVDVAAKAAALGTGDLAPPIVQLCGIYVLEHGLDGGDSDLGTKGRHQTESGQGMKGKHKYLDEQFNDSDYQILFFQETKDKGGVVESGNYLRMATSAAKHWGVAIWIHRKQGLMTIGDKALCVDESDVKICKQGPRILVVEVNKCGLRCILISAHIPHATKKVERVEFLCELHQCLRAAGKADIVIGGIDSNSRPPTGFAQVTGLLEFGESDPEGEQFTTMLDACNLWLPATYRELHPGSSATFRHPTSNLHRIDFLALGGRTHPDGIRSFVDEAIDVGSVRDDHFVVGLDLGGWMGLREGSRKLNRPKYDRAKMMTSEGREILRRAYEAYQALPWWEHIDNQYKHFQDYVQQVLADYFPPPRVHRTSYVPDKVWVWRAQKLSLKKRTKDRKTVWERALHAALLQWRHGIAGLLDMVTRKDGLLYQLAASAITFKTHQIKKEIYKGKASFLQDVVREGPQSAAGILQRVKKFGVGGRQNSRGDRPLPLLLDTNGEAASSQADYDKIWLKHFGKQEYGTVMPTAAFKQPDVADHFGAGVTWCPADLPTVQELETILRTIPKNKAVGLDCIPGEALRASPAAAAMALFPTVLRAALGFTQPLQWRGGVIFTAWKKSGAISCFVAAKKHHRSIGAIFLDTTAAYYRVLREAMVGDICYDETIAWLMKRFNMGPEEMAGLWATINAGGIVNETGMPEALQAQLKDVHHRTWCVSRHTDGTRVVVTKAGSRPGESLADAVFSYIYTRVLGKIWETACGEDLLSAECADLSEGLFAPPKTGLETSIRDVTWADDTAMMFDDEVPDRCIRTGKRLASLTISICEDYGLQPNLKVGKTTMVLALTGKGVQKARRTHFDGDRRSLPLADLQAAVPVASQYTHLGGVLDRRMEMKPEMRRRLVIATSSLEAGNKLIFSNATIPLNIRTQMFETAILSTFHNIALWIPAGPAWRSLCGGYTRLLRRLLGTRYKGDRLFDVPAPFVHIATRSWSLELQATKSRLGALTAMVRSAPVPLWAVLQREQQWFTVVSKDLALIKHRQYWNMERLSTHLRDSAKCVSWLRTHGRVAAGVMPGKGSKEFRRRSMEEFNLAPTQQVHLPNPAGEAEIWVDEQRQAYRAICEGLTDRARWHGIQEIRDFIMDSLAEFPLYFHEEKIVVGQLAMDAALLWHDDPEGQWDSDTSHLMMIALDQEEQWHKPYVEATHVTAEAECSLWQFMSSDASIDWNGLLRENWNRCGTPERARVKLGSDWEASEVEISRAWTAEAAFDDLMCFVPEKVKELWQGVLKGAVAQIDAPPDFWRSPYGPIFEGLRETASN